MLQSIEYVYVNRRDSISTECNFKMKMYTAHAMGFHFLADAATAVNAVVAVAVVAVIVIVARVHIAA